MFHRKPKTIVPYSPPNNNSNSKKPDPTSTDTLNKMRNSQMITNAEYMQLSLQKEILQKLNQIEYNTRATAAATGFTGAHIKNKYFWE